MKNIGTGNFFLPYCLLAIMEFYFDSNIHYFRNKALIPHYRDAPDKVLKNAIFLTMINIVIFVIFIVFWNNIAGVFG